MVIFDFRHPCKITFELVIHHDISSKKLDLNTRGLKTNTT